MFQHGYIAVYQGNDFCKIEGFPNKMEDMSENVAYIWEVVTRKEVIRLHEKYGFKELYRFEEKEDNKIKQQIMFVKNRH